MSNPTQKNPSDARRLIGRSLTRSVTPEQINASQARDRRAVSGRVRSFDEGDRTAELAFSSEEPVSRWFGNEILSHEAGAVDMTRLEGGAALLLNHDPNQQIGVIESARVDGDRRGRAVVRFSRSAKAQEVFQDVVDGIRRHVSVGYTVGDLSVTERSDGPDDVTLTRWQPHEISIVSIPADPTVGIGRSAEETPSDPVSAPVDTPPDNPKPIVGEIRNMNEQVIRAPNGDLVRAMVDADGAIAEVLEVLEAAGSSERAAADSERNRSRIILEMGKAYGAETEAQTAARDGTSVADFQRAMLDLLNSRRGSTVIEEGASSSIGLTDREASEFSFMRAIRALSDPLDKRLRESAAFEFEASRAAADAAGRESQGIMVPPDVMRRALNTSTTGAAAGDTGGNVVATDLQAQSFIEMLRNRAVAMRMSRILSGLVGNMDIPKQSETTTGYWIGEDDDAGESSIELGQLSMSPKTVAGLHEVTRRMLMQSSIDVESLIRSDLATTLALEIDRAVFYGSGTSNVPLGIVNTSGLPIVDFGGAASGGGSAMPTYQEFVEMETVIATANADVSGMAYVMGAGMRGYAKSTQKFPGTDGATIWESGGSVNGYRAEITNQILPGDVFFGNFADLIIGMWGGLDLTVDPYTHSKKGRVRIVMMQDVDFLVRRAQSFCLGRDAT